MLAVSTFFKTEKVTFVYLDLKNKDEVKIELTEELIKEYRAKLNEIKNKIELGDFSKKKNDYKCEYNSICY
jgi:CRISPR/Cas system-associated exonuclease Cas4 (RecB family)